MIHSRLLLLLALLVTLVLSAPTSKIQKRSFKVHRKRNLSFTGRHGPRELLKAYQKFSMGVPEGLHRSAAHRRPQLSSTLSTVNIPTNGTGIVAATPVEPNDLEYIAAINIGGQTLNMNFDTGSSDLWVFNTQLGAQQRKGHTVYDPKRSSTFQFLQGHTFTISYGDGSGASGNVGTDTVSIGGVSVSGQAIELATKVSASFIADTNSNGLVGLAFSTLNTVQPNKQRTFFDNVMPSLPTPVFTADLRQDEVGAYEFGAIDASRFQGDLTWAPINTANGFWQFSSTKFSVGDGQVLNAIGGSAIADTGTTLILVNPAVVNAYYGQVAGAVNNATVGGITFPCDAVLPDLFVDVGGVYMARVEGRFINFAVVDGNSKTGPSVISAVN
jgi:hypothetical protein